MPRQKGQMAQSMRKSLNDEAARLQARFEKAEALFGSDDVAIESKAEITKVIRDTFTMPPDDHALLDRLKARALSMGQAITKSELVRAGLHALYDMPETNFKEAINQVEKIKPGRPK